MKEMIWLYFPLEIRQNENIELIQENMDLIRDNKKLNKLFNEKDWHNAQLKSELKSYLTQIKEKAKKCV